MIMNMSGNGPVVDLSAIAATFPGQCLTAFTNTNTPVVSLTPPCPDLTSEERQLLLDIRRRKAELLQEISQLKEEITEISGEIDAMDTEEG